MVKVWSPEATRGSETPFLTRFHYPIILVLIALASLVAFGPGFDGLSRDGQRVLGIFLLCTGFWVSGVIPLQITSILAIALMPLLDVMSSAQAFALFGNKAVFFILGAFILSAVLVDCGLSSRLTCLALQRLSVSAVTLRNGILLFAAFASFWMSEHAVAAMLFPIVRGIVRAMNLKPMESRFGMSFFFALAWGCVIGGIATYLGGARNPLAAGILFEETGEHISFGRWMTASLPIVLIMLGVAYTILNVFYREEPVDMKAAREILALERERIGPLTPRESAVGVISLLTIAAWVLLHSMLGLATIALLSVTCMFLFRLTRWSVIEENVNWGIILMYGGAIALGSALTSTGASEWIVDRSLGRFDLPPRVMIILLGALSLLLTEFISNAAVVSVLMPVAIQLGISNDIPLEVITFAVALPSGLSYILPMGTPATAIAYSSGFMSHRHFLQIGPVMAVISWTVFALVAYFIWPLMGY